MTRIVRSQDCGNSPKNVFVENLAVAMAKRDAKWLLDAVTDDVQWHRVGATTIVGKAAVATALEDMRRDEVARLTVANVLSHGRTGAVNGVAGMRDGRQVDFCDVFEFGNAKGTSVKAITSYHVERK